MERIILLLVFASFTLADINILPSEIVKKSIDVSLVNLEVMIDRLITEYNAAKEKDIMWLTTSNDNPLSQLLKRRSIPCRELFNSRVDEFVQQKIEKTYDGERVSLRFYSDWIERIQREFEKIRDVVRQQVISVLNYNFIIGRIAEINKKIEEPVDVLINEIELWKADFDKYRLGTYPPMDEAFLKDVSRSLILPVNECYKRKTV